MYLIPWEFIKTFRGWHIFSLKDFISASYRTDMIRVFHFYMIFYFIRFNWTEITNEFDLNSNSLQPFQFSKSPFPRSFLCILYQISPHLILLFDSVSIIFHWNSLLFWNYHFWYCMGLFINWCICLIFLPNFLHGQIRSHSSVLNLLHLMRCFLFNESVKRVH